MDNLKKKSIDILLLGSITKYFNKNSLNSFFTKFYGFKNKSIKFSKKLGISNRYFFCMVMFNTDQIKNIYQFLDYEGKSSSIFKLEEQGKRKFILLSNVYKSRQFKKGLPANGQRTHSNGRTAKYLLKVKPYSKKSNLKNGSEKNKK